MTETSPFTFFTPAADAIVGIDCPTLVRSLTNAHPRTFPEKIDTIIGVQHVFQFYFNPTCKKGAVDFILSAILDDPQQSTQAKTPTSDGSTQVETTAAMDCLSTPQAPQHSDHSSGTSTPVSTYTGMQTRLRTEIPTDVTETPYTGMQVTSKTDTRTEQSHKLTTKRPLFQEEDTENKKKEKLKHRTPQVPNNIHGSHQLLPTKVLTFFGDQTM